MNKLVDSITNPHKNHAFSNQIKEFLDLIHKKWLKKKK